MASILIVDDEASVREVLRESVSILGHESEEASDGMEALERFRARRFDVVITDLSMPRLDGIELTRRLRRLDPNLPVLVVTGRTSLDIKAMAWNRGIVDYLLKPFRVSTLAETLQRAVQQRELEVVPEAVPLEARRPSGLTTLLILLAILLGVLWLWSYQDYRQVLRALTHRVEGAGTQRL